MESSQKTKHVRYFERHFVYFPSNYQKYDSSITSLVYFCCLGLDLMGKPVPSELVDWVWERYTEGGFKGSLTHADGDFSTASTYFCLSILAMARASLKEGAKPGIKRAVQRLQLPDGSFCGSNYKGQPASEPSLRYTYSGLGSLYLLGESLDASLTQKTINYILECQNYDGGFGDFGGSESHAGLTYCAIVSLVVFCGHDLDPSRRTKVINYLLRCQQENGGFNGRVNKNTDTCYSFWVCATLKVLGAPYYNAQLGIKYLYRSQHQIGGFYKVEGDLPDPFHSALALAALSILGEKTLGPIESALCLPKSAADWIKQWE